MLESRIGAHPKVLSSANGCIPGIASNDHFGELIDLHGIKAERGGQDEEDDNGGGQPSGRKTTTASTTAAVESLGVVYDDSAISRTERNQKVRHSSRWINR